MAEKEHPRDDDAKVKVDWVDPDPVIIDKYPSTASGPGVSLSSSVGMSGASFTASTADSASTTEESSGGSGADFGAGDAWSSLAEETKKHAWCESHSAGLGWLGPTRRGPDAQSLAQSDADQHNVANPTHQAVVFDGEGVSA